MTFYILTIISIIQEKWMNHFYQDQRNQYIQPNQPNQISDYHMNF